MKQAFDDMLESLVDPVMVINSGGILLEANPAACRMFGWTREELIGGPVTKLMAEPYRSEHDGYLQNFLTTGETKAIGRVRKVTAQHRSGREFPCELSVSFAMVDGEHRFYGIVRDMTEREEMVARLSQVERLAAMGELAAGVAHEVNNPVNTIINCAQLVKDGDDDPTLLDDIIQEGMRIAMIVRDLLDFAADRSDQFVPVSLADVTERVTKLVARRLERQGIHVEAEHEPDLPTVSGISHQIQQVLLNLVLNARDVLTEVERDEPRIVVHVRRAEFEGRPAVQLSVRDNGPGVAEADRERIFEPFVSKKKSNGTGLGLAVSRGIVSDHGGTIELDSVLGEYAEFRITLPAD